MAVIKNNKATVVSENRTEYKVPLSMLKLRKGINPRRVYTQSQLKQLEFEVADEVCFEHANGKLVIGKIVLLNPKRARVKSDGCLWDVPYEGLRLTKPNNRGEQNKLRMDNVSCLADELLAKHKLHDWRFVYDDARARGGLCSSYDQIISISKQFCLNANDEEIMDTLLHEIAHALVGADQGHNKIWRAKALEIGCSGERTLQRRITKPRYVISCETCGWGQTRHKRQYGLICSKCERPIRYALYTDELWNSYQPNLRNQPGV